VLFRSKGEIRGVDKGDRFQLSEIQGLASPWSKPSKGASSKAEVVEDPQEKTLSRKVSLDSMDSGSSSTIENDEKKSFFSKLGFSKGKGKEKAEEEEISDSSFPLFNHSYYFWTLTYLCHSSYSFKEDYYQLHFENQMEPERNGQYFERNFSRFRSGRFRFWSHFERSRRIQE